MSEFSFETNIIRAMFAELHFQTGMLAAREMFDKSYFALGQAEKIAVDQAVIGYVASNYNMLTPEWLAGQKQSNPIGFQGPPQPAQPQTATRSEVQT